MHFFIMQKIIITM